MSDLLQQLPASLKKFRKFLLNANQAERIRPVAAYQARLYVAKQLMQDQKTPDSQGFLLKLLDSLEKTPLEVRSKSEEESAADVSDFALGIFGNAHKEDSEGRANKRTVTAFMTAWVFLETLKNFGARDPDVEEKAKYCLFKVKDITQAIREGRKPTPGNPFDQTQQLDDDASLGSGLSSDSPPAEPTHSPMPSTTSMPTSQPTSQPTSMPSFMDASRRDEPTLGLPQQPARVATQTATNVHVPTGNEFRYDAPAQVRSATAAGGGVYPVGNDPSKKPHAAPAMPAPARNFSAEDKVRDIMQAEKITKHAMAAMRFADTHTAVEKLREVVLLLLPYSSVN